jgi:SAM-dependent methyltransferase
MLRKSLFVGFSLVVMTALVTAQGTQKVPAKPIKLAVLVPHEAAAVSVDDVEFKGEGLKRSFTARTTAGKNEVHVVAVWEPNDYTRITRPRKVAWKDGEIVVDMREPSKTEKDDIVVRFVPTPQEFVDAMCKLAKIGKDDVVYDLGCGDGRMAFTAVKSFGAKRAVGVDLDPMLVELCKKKTQEAKLESKLTFRVGDVLKLEDLSEASVVMLYMGDFINHRLKPILQKTLRPGSRVVSHRFLMGDDWAPEKSERVKATMGEFPGYEHDIHLWTIKGEKK